MNQAEFIKIMEMAFAEYTPATPQIRMVWWDALSTISFDAATAAVRLMLRGQIYGKPRISDFWAAHNTIQKEQMPKSLIMSPSEALTYTGTSYLLIKDAEHFANWVCRNESASAQYRSEIELEEARRIERAIWEREFKQRFEKMQGRALGLIKIGCEPRTAIVKTIADYSRLNTQDALPPAAQELLTLAAGEK